MQRTEADFTSLVIDCARLFGWRVAHFRAARIIRNGKETWRTPVQADGAGFPDLVLVRGEQLLFVELKSDMGRLSPAQEMWREAIKGVNRRSPPVRFLVWRPSDWPEIEQALKGE